MEKWDVLDENKKATGKTHIKGDTFLSGEYHLIVYAWIMNSNNEYLVQKRAATKTPFPNIWTCSAGGSAISGETSIEAILREIKEELGIVIDSKKGILLHTEKMESFFADVWLFKHDVCIDDLTLQKEEVGDAMWASQEKVDKMLANKTMMAKASCYHVLKNKMGS